MSAKAPAKGHTTKHVHHKKHAAAKPKHHPVKQKQAAAKAPGHNVHTVAKPAAPAKARGYAVGDLLPVCAFEALAMSLRLAGQFVGDDEVAWLWELAGAAPFGATLAAALDAAGERGFAGFRPRWKQITAPVTADHVALPLTEDQAVPVGPFEDLFAGDFHGLILDVEGKAGRDSNPRLPISGCYAFGRLRLPHGALSSGPPAFPGLILGIDVPGPHCVLATADGWWSWGELHDPWPARIEEAWAVSWT